MTKSVPRVFVGPFCASHPCQLSLPNLIIMWHLRSLSDWSDLQNLSSFIPLPSSDTISQSLVQVSWCLPSDQTEVTFLSLSGGGFVRQRIEQQPRRCLWLHLSLPSHLHCSVFSAAYAGLLVFACLSLRGWGPKFVLHPPCFQIQEQFSISSAFYLLGRNDDFSFFHVGLEAQSSFHEIMLPSVLCRQQERHYCQSFPCSRLGNAKLS